MRKILTVLFCLFLVSPMRALDWEVIDSSMTILNDEITELCKLRDDIAVLKRLDEHIDNDSLINSLLIQIRAKMETAAQNIKDLFE